MRYPSLRAARGAALSAPTSKQETMKQVAPTDVGRRQLQKMASSSIYRSRGRPVLRAV